MWRFDIESPSVHPAAGIFRALSRARYSILAVALAYILSVAVGIVLVHAGNAYAISQRDSIVGSAQSSPTLIAFNQNHRIEAALLDFGGNLVGAVSSTLTGLGVVFPFPFIVYRGWVGGIVSIDGNHISRLADPSSAAYYLITLILQLIPYTLAGGAGVNLGVSLWRPLPEYHGKKLLTMPVEAILDVGRIYFLVVPLFLIACLFEFIAV